MTGIFLERELTEMSSIVLSLVLILCVLVGSNVVYSVYSRSGRLPFRADGESLRCYFSGSVCCVLCGLSYFQ